MLAKNTLEMSIDGIEGAKFVKLLKNNDDTHNSDTNESKLNKNKRRCL